MRLEINGPANIILGINYVRQLLSEERYNEIFHILDLMDKDAQAEMSFLKLISNEIEKHGVSLKTCWLDAKNVPYNPGL